MPHTRYHDPARPWPTPRRPWLAEQTWERLLLAHWPVPTAALRAVVPADFPLDTYDGQAWVSVVPFLLSGGRLRGLPPLPGMRTATPELNVRTYVTRDGKPGVYFFSIDVGNRGAVLLARTLFRAPYYHAMMRFATDGKTVALTSERPGPGGPTHRFAGRGQPTGPAGPAAPGSLDAWLTNRFCLYLHALGRPARIDIDHAPWSLHAATGEFTVSELALPGRVTLSDPPARVHYVERITARIWPPTRPR